MWNLSFLTFKVKYGGVLHFYYRDIHVVIYVPSIVVFQWKKDVQKFNLCGGGCIFQGSAGSELTKAWGLNDSDSNMARHVIFFP